MLLLMSILIFCAGGVILFCFVRYHSLKRKYTLLQSVEKVKEPFPEPDFEGFIQRFSWMIQIPTVS